jgi:hypothetical protein
MTDEHKCEQNVRWCVCPTDEYHEENLSDKGCLTEYRKCGDPAVIHVPNMDCNKCGLTHDMWLCLKHLDYHLGGRDYVELDGSMSPKEIAAAMQKHLDDRREGK